MTLSLLVTQAIYLIFQACLGIIDHTDSFSVMQEVDFDKMRLETFSEFCTGGGQKGMAAPGLWAMQASC